MPGRRLRRATTAAVLTVLALIVLEPIAIADQVYHTEKVAFEAVGDAPLRDGFVVNIHPNGPNVYAHEVYTLKGAESNTGYQVYLVGYVQDPDCSGEASFELPTAALTTNAAGNGKSSVKLSPADVEGLRNMTHGVRWVITHSDSSETVYQTACTTVVLD